MIEMIIIGAYPDQVNHTIENLGELIDELFPKEIVLHIMPFQSSCGDGGYAINDWYTVDSQFGSWENIEKLARKRHIILDGVFNHVGIEHNWVKQFCNNPTQYKDRFYVNKNNRLNSPRGQPADIKIKTVDGDMYIRQTHMDKTVDINLENSFIHESIDKYLEFLKKKGVWGIRLDAVAYYKKGPLIRHNIGAQAVANSIADLTLSKGFFTMAQLDCDKPGNSYFLEEMYKDIAIFDFSYSAFLCAALANGQIEELAKHLFETSQLKRLLIRAPRTHDGILLRSGYLNENILQALIEFANMKGIAVRYAKENAYELNCSFPYLSKHICEEEFYRILNMSIVFTGVLNSIPYYYLPYVLGEIPEENGNDQIIPDRFIKEDPRTLNRLPLRNKLRLYDTRKKELIEIFQRLSILRENIGTEMMLGDACFTVNKSIMRISIAHGKIVGYFNFSREVMEVENHNNGHLFISNDENSDLLKAYGYKVYISLN